MINDAVRDALAERLLGMADDELILAHRNSEWAGHGPILEEDIAFANIALDELGHAAIWYGLRGELTGEDADRLIFFRNPGQYRNIQLVELPKGDWAFSMVRQYLFDAAENVMLRQLAAGGYRPLAEAATKIATEEIYHLRHTGLWLRRMGLGTDESHARAQTALDTLWPYARQLFASRPEDGLLMDAGIIPDAALLWREWESLTRPFLAECALLPPADALPRRDIPRTEHTEHLMGLLAEMQAVARLDPEAEW
ncbi:MAG: phenylacetate-CoA oxygenase subunit PaaC [Anaerolineae bacterium]|uniref:1,2-phenylacetyl-CoA epoxidase subunit PaaC n=1 Tax=Promineifilum sp. TaxID=2664178 RepID=UPI001DF45A75|nr:phenylacetate-CoA oxygenase subunit PaaC [Anaerolineales bacterium]MCO5180813.1 phenylacetate-CoA oxygenase subunit PaaC [Promineifilum sp.]MCW5846012.1 phenylacetate-CoA oxygenase subunit PaaC [Anaerolineae bacterium]